jgi:hypothetical protein
MAGIDSVACLQRKTVSVDPLRSRSAIESALATFQPKIGEGDSPARKSAYQSVVSLRGKAGRA